MLAALLLRPEASLHVREIARLTGANAGSLHRELRALAALGLLTREEIGRQVHYRADTQSPVHDDLVGLLRKTAGTADVLGKALLPLSDRIVAAFVYGSMASGKVHAHSDVDIMIIGDVGFADTVVALQPAQSTLRREVNPTVLGLEEFREKLRQSGGFVASVWKEPKIWVMGGADELG